MNNQKDGMIEFVARSLMAVCARPPAAIDDREFPVLDADFDFDDLPLNGDQGTSDDTITQEAVLRLAAAAVCAVEKYTNKG